MPRLLLQLKEALINPSDGSSNRLVAGDFETADENNYVAATAYGKVCFPRDSVQYPMTIDDSVTPELLGSLDAVRVLN